MFNNDIHISEWIASLNTNKPFYLAVIDKFGSITFCNVRFYTEFVPGNVLPSEARFFDLVPKNEHDHFKEILASAALQENPITTQIRVNNGLCRWVKWEVSCISGYTEPQKFICMGHDIADEVQIKRTDEILRLNYQNIVEDLMFAILLQDTEGNVITANQKAAEIFNTTLEQLYADKDLPLPCRTTGGGHLAIPLEETAFSKTVRTRQAQTNIVIEVPLHRGRSRTILCNWQPLFEKNESVPYSVLSSFQDITKEKQFEKEAKSTSEHLSLVEAQLVQHRLKEKKGTAEAIIGAQEDERTRIGHELHDNVNQILASCKMYMSLLHKAGTNFEQVKKRATKLLDLAVAELRKLSKAFVLPDLKQGSLVESVNDLIKDLRFSNLFDVTFRHGEAPELEEMSLSKKVTLFRIVQEQTKNILQYSKATAVDISLHRQNNCIRLQIRDNGIGFDPEKTCRGLGLSNIYERARLNDGQVTLDASPGRGCSIVVTIPC